MNHQTAIPTQQSAECDSGKRSTHTFDIGAEVVGEDTLGYDGSTSKLPECGARSDALSDEHSRKDTIDGDVVVEIAIG